MQEKRPFGPASSNWLIAFCLLSLVLARAQTFEVLHTFNGLDGGYPMGVLAKDEAGNLYGTASAGGTGKCGKYRCGTAFMLNKAGKLVGTYSFGGSNGMEPVAGLLRDAKGNFYGTTVFGGDTNASCQQGCGTAFKLSPTGKETVLHKFTGSPDGWLPQSLLVEDAAGNLYGTTVQGGPNGFGTVFKIATTGEETVLYSFTGDSDGCFPYPGVILDASGNLYGVTSDGGSGFGNSGYGVVFKVDTAGNETVLHTFGGADGANPSSTLIFDSQGNLYGTTQNGGSSEGCGFSGCGTIFELSPQQDGSWTEGVLYSFCSLPECADGERPLAGPLAQDGAGNLYGTTIFGGQSTNQCNGSCGVVFKLDTAEQETVLHSFTGGSDGAFPWAGLVMDEAGKLYGTTQQGGSACLPNYTCGLVFEITP
jgi:uncharacterized repeat protein (TIGR03803 family)